MASFDEAVDFVIKAEGGYTTADGTPTNYGITQTLYDKWMRSRGQAIEPVLGIDLDTAKKIYQEWFWEATAASNMPYPVAVAVFDSAVNMGQDRAIRILQRALWIDEDGVIGMETIGEVSKSDPMMLSRSYLSLRRQYYLCMKTPLDRFKRGWLNRVSSLWDHILQQEGWRV